MSIGMSMIRVEGVSGGRWSRRGMRMSMDGLSGVGLVLFEARRVVVVLRDGWFVFEREIGEMG